MRLVAKFTQENLARKLSSFLRKEGINNVIESEIDPASNQRNLLIWVEDEDQTDRAYQIYEEFLKNPDDPKYNISYAQEYRKRPLIQQLPIKLQEKPKQIRHPFTMAIIGICAFIFIFNYFQEKSIRNEEGKDAEAITPIQLLMFYDAPKPLTMLSEVVKKYPVGTFRSTEDFPLALQQDLMEIEKMPQWRGLYSWLLIKLRKDPIEPSGPMFVKIRAGQVWRLFSPCILHTSFLHILFNMLWAWILLKQVEFKVKNWKIILMILCMGIVSNTAQYLMSGPLFLGFSGVVIGLAGFIWARQKIAPWEGYTIQKSTFLFLTIYIFGMMALQIFAFIFQSVGSTPFQSNIANTAHIAGGIVGWILGKSSFFSSEAT